MARILVVDDEQSIREMLEIHLQREGFDVLCASNGLEALGLCRKESFDVVVADIKMPKMDGMSLLHQVKELAPQTVFIMVTAFASYETARESMQDDAYDYITKPFDVEEVTRKIEAALKQKAAIETTGAGSAAAAEKGQSRFGMIGICKAMHKVHDLIERSAASKSNILITGESGTGKELVARAVHDNSARSAQPFVTINCGGIPENLLESELFGYKKGAFTGAMRDKKGFLEIADSGTLFLDEVGELPLALQVKLLRMVQEKTFTAVGGTEEIVVDVRFISATNKDLQKKVLEGTFREDLYYRLNVVNIAMPPLRERAEDIPLLVSHFMQKYSVEMEKEVREISSYALDCLMNYRFPGNVRELENIIERGIALEKTSIMLPDSLELSQASESPGPQRGDNGMADYTIPPEGVMLEDLLVASEKRFMQEALKMSKGSIKGAAKLLGLTFRSMRYRLEKLSMDVREFK